MKYVLITGSSGLVGSEAVNFFIKRNLKLLQLIIIYVNIFLGKMLILIGKKKIKSKI